MEHSPDQEERKEIFNQSITFGQHRNSGQSDLTAHKLCDELELANDKIAVLETKLNREIIANLTLKDEIARFKNMANTDVQDKRKTSIAHVEFPKSISSEKQIDSVDPSVPPLNPAAHIKMQATIDELQAQLTSCQAERDKFEHQLSCYNEFNLPFQIDPSQIYETNHNIGFEK